MPDSTSITKAIDILLFWGMRIWVNWRKSVESDILAPNKDMKVKFGTKPFLSMRTNCKKDGQNP